MQIRSKLPKVGTTIFTVMSQLAARHGAVNLGQGFPDFDGPQRLRDALTEAMAAHRNQYAPMTGVPQLRQQIALKCERLHGAKIDPDSDITVTSGATEAVFAVVAAVVHAGEEVIVLDPCYDCYEPAIELAGARAVHVPLALPDFRVDWQRVADAITPRTRLVILNTPHNPAGTVLSAEDWASLADIVRDQNIFILSDEVYEHIVFDGAPHQSVLRHAELAARSFVVSSFGKTYHCTGWKVGYCIAPAALSVEFRKVHQFLTFSTFTPAQWAFADVLEHDPQHYLQLPEFYQAKRDRFRQWLAPSKFKLLPVAGSYFQIADYSAFGDEGDMAFCERLIAQAGVAAIPVSAFYQTPPNAHLIRFCFAKNEETLKDAAERLCRL